MLKRRLRIGKTNPSLLGACERCNAQFKADSEAEIRSTFEAHKCTLGDSSQNAMRVVDEATDGK